MAGAEQSVEGAAEILAPVLRRLSRAQRESAAALLLELGRCPGGFAEEESWGRPGREPGRW